MIESPYGELRDEGEVGHAEFMRRANEAELRRQADFEDDFMRHWPLESIQEYLAGGGNPRRAPTEFTYRRCVEKGRAILRGKDGPGMGAEPLSPDATTQSI